MNGSAVDPLARYYSGTARRTPHLDQRGGIHGHVDALLAHLRVPCRLDPDGDWLIHNDSGLFTLFVRASDERVVLRQKVMSIDGEQLAAEAGDLQLLMQLNLECEGACFASQEVGDGYMVVITGQLPWEGLDAERLGGLLEAGFGLAADLDEALQDEDEDEDEPSLPEVEPEPEPEPYHLGTAPTNGSRNGNGDGSWPADWYEDPKGEARLRYFDGSTWTDHTAV